MQPETGYMSQTATARQDDQLITNPDADVRFALLADDDRRDRPTVFERNMTYDHARKVAAKRNAPSNAATEFEVVTMHALELLLENDVVQT